MAATYTTPNELTGTADWSGGWLHGETGKPLDTWSSMQADGDTVTVTKSKWNGPSKYVAVKAGETWAFSAEVRGNDCGGIFIFVALNSATENGHARAECTRVSATVRECANPPTGEWQVVSCIWKMTSDGYIRPRAECSAATGTMQLRHYMLTNDTALPAYAPANGETLVASAVSATPTNILAPKADSATGTRWQVDGTGGALTSNAIVHTGVSVETPTAGGANVYVRYADSTGHANAVRAATRAFSAGEVARLCGDATLPAGMTPAGIVCTSALTDIVWSAPSLSIGGAVTLASSAHTPYATQDHLRSEYATKAALKVTSDAVTAEVTERGKLAGRVGTLESTTGTHTSKLEQLATSIKSLVRGESTYTDPDGQSATSGIYSLVTQTRDSVTALFGDYTKTADLASTQAVKDAKKAGTDAQAAASAAQTTADSLATMVRQYSGGVLVCKVGQQVGALVNADGSFDVADVTWNSGTPTVGKKLMRLAKNSIEFNNPDTSYNICNITANGTLTNINVPNGSLAIDEMPAWCQANGDSGYDSFIAGQMLQLGAGNRTTHSEILIEPDGTTINGYKFALGTNNTTDTWVPVMGGNSNAGHLVHRVINLKWGPNAYAVYGAYNPNNGGDHYYTTNVNEYNKLIKSGWTGSGVYFYAAL